MAVFPLRDSPESAISLRFVGYVLRNVYRVSLLLDQLILGELRSLYTHCSIPLTYGSLSQWMGVWNTIGIQ